MKILKYTVLFLIFSLGNARGGEDAEALYKDGLTLLKEVMAGDETKLVAAAASFAKAALLYETAGDEPKAQEANSSLYWCKKRMNVSQINAFLENKGKAPELAQKLEQISKPVDASNAQTFFNNADTFERGNPQNHLLIAIRYFEVADRFAGSPVSIEAQKRSLSAMQKLNIGKDSQSKVPAVDATPAGTVLEKEYAAFNDSIAKAREKLLAAMDRALTDESKRGNLDAALVMKNEIERLSKPNAFNVTDTKIAPLALAQKAFTAAVIAEKKKFLATIEPKMKEATRAGNLDLALKLKEERKSFLGAPKDASEFNGHFYKFYWGEKSWPASKQFCEEMNGYLVCVESPAENDFLIKTFSNEWQQEARVWLGASNELGTWFWLTGTPVTNFGWMPGEPNGGKNKRMDYWKSKGKNASGCGWDDCAPDDQFLVLCEWGF